MVASPPAAFTMVASPPAAFPVVAPPPVPSSSGRGRGGPGRPPGSKNKK